MGQRWFVDRHLPSHTYQSSEIFRDHRAARPDAEGWTPKHLTDRRQATKEGRRRIDPFQNLFVVLQDIAARPVTHTALIPADGIEWRGQRYRSLSVVARKITGARWSGPRFFGLRQRQLDSTSTARPGHGQG